MSVINSDNRDAWQALADTCKAQFPSVGKSVKIVDGRKHKGKMGIVTWHGVNKFVSRQYWTDAQYHLRDMQGRYGFSVRIKTVTGETFFVPAEYTEVIQE